MFNVHEKRGENEAVHLSRKYDDDNKAYTHSY